MGHPTLDLRAAAGLTGRALVPSHRTSRSHARAESKARTASGSSPCASTVAIGLPAVIRVPGGDRSALQAGQAKSAATVTARRA